MPRACSICTSPKKTAILTAIDEGGSNRSIAARYGLTHTAVQRHKANCMGIKPKREAAAPAPLTSDDCGEPPRVGGTERFDSMEPKVLIAGTARLVDEALGLLEHAKKKDDRRLALAALKEARDGLALLMRAAGMLAGDSAGSVMIDQRNQTVQLFGKMTEDELRALARGAGGVLADVTDNQALPALPITIEAEASGVLEAS